MRLHLFLAASVVVMPLGVAAQTTNESDAASAAPSRREQRFHLHNAFEGAVGGIRVVDAGSSVPGSFRIQLAGEYFTVRDWLLPHDRNTRVGSVLSLGVTVTDFLEVFGAIDGAANHNSRETPELIQTLGDSLLGVKGFYALNPWLTVGGDITVALLSGIGDVGVGWRGTGVGLRANAAADLRALPSRLPLIARANARYVFDNSSNLAEDVESSRYDALDSPLARRNETRHLLSPVERFALDVNRTDFFDVGLGVEAPLQVARGFYVHPIGEWTWRIPVNRRGYSCAYLSGADSSKEDSCLDREGLSSFPMKLTLGVRVLPKVRGLAALLGVDIGLTGTRDFVRELAPTAPYNVLFSVSYAYDTKATRVATMLIERQEIEEVERALRARVRGIVVDRTTKEPIARAIVHFPGRDVTDLATSPDGTFVSEPFNIGDVAIELHHPDYEPGACSARIAPSKEVPSDVGARCELAALPRVGILAGRVLSTDGEPVAGARVSVPGVDNASVIVDEGGAFRLTDLPEGPHTLRIEADGYFAASERVEVPSRRTAEVTVTVVPRPKRALVRVRKRDIEIRKQIRFAAGSDGNSAASFPLMYEIADVMVQNPELARIEIQGHTDDRGGAALNLALSQRRADSVKAWLVAHGVEERRLESKGYGASRPLVPNITPAHRARNRRVQFVIVERAAAESAAR